MATGIIIAAVTTGALAPFCGSSQAARKNRKRGFEIFMRRLAGMSAGSGTKTPPAPMLLDVCTGTGGVLDTAPIQNMAGESTLSWHGYAYGFNIANKNILGHRVQFTSTEPGAELCPVLTAFGLTASHISLRSGDVAFQNILMEMKSLQVERGRLVPGAAAGCVQLCQGDQPPCPHGGGATTSIYPTAAACPPRGQNADFLAAELAKVHGSVKQRFPAKVLKNLKSVPEDILKYYVVSNESQRGRLPYYSADGVIRPKQLRWLLRKLEKEIGYVLAFLHRCMVDEEYRRRFLLDSLQDTAQLQKVIDWLSAPGGLPELAPHIPPIGLLQRVQAGIAAIPLPLVPANYVDPPVDPCTQFVPLFKPPSTVPTVVAAEAAGAGAAGAATGAMAAGAAVEGLGTVAGAALGGTIGAAIGGLIGSTAAALPAAAAGLVGGAAGMVGGAMQPLVGSLAAAGVLSPGRPALAAMLSPRRLLAGAAALPALPALPTLGGGGMEVAAVEDAEGSEAAPAPEEADPEALLTAAEASDLAGLRQQEAQLLARQQAVLAMAASRARAREQE